MFSVYKTLFDLFYLDGLEIEAFIEDFLRPEAWAEADSRRLQGVLEI